MTACHTDARHRLSQSSRRANASPGVTATGWLCGNIMVITVPGEPSHRRLSLSDSGPGSEIIVGVRFRLAESDSDSESGLGGKRFPTVTAWP